MILEITMMYLYRFMALAIAAMMVWNIVKSQNWQNQVFSVMIFVPFILRAVGVK